MTTKTRFPVNGQKKVVHAVTERGAKIIRRTKDDTWYMERGKSRIALTMQEAAFIAAGGYVIHGLEGGESFENIVKSIWSRAVVKKRKKHTTKVTAGVPA